MATVLLVDDRTASREVARATLELGGHQVIEAREGRQALAVAQASRPDIVLTDVLMPGMDGYRFVRELRSHPGTTGIPVLFYTAAYRTDEAQPLAELSGVSGIIPKDAPPQILLDAIASALREAPAAATLVEADFDVRHASTVNAKLLEKVQALDESEARFAAMAQASPVGIVITDPYGRATYVNPRLSDITQAAAADLLGEGWLQCLGHDQREALRAAPGCLLPSLDGQRHQAHVTLASGRERWLAVLIRPVRDAELTVTGFVAMVDDVTAVIEAEEQRRAGERERENEQRRRAAARFDSLARMAGGTAHDFNNLLYVIMTFGEFAREAVVSAAGAVLTEKQAKDIVGDLDEIHRAGQRAAHLTGQLLTFGGREVVKPAVVDINVLIGEVRDTIADTIGQHITITTKLDPDLGHVLADASQLRQVLLNLAVNARDAMPNGGGLHLETTNIPAGTSRPAASLPPGDCVHIAVTDTGQGMPAAIAAQAMEPFFTTKPAGQGAGLGLATAYGTIKQAGGELTIDSAPGRGTTMHIYLPATSRPPAAAARVAAGPGAEGRTILLAEDEDGVRQAVTRILTRAGYRVLAAPNGQDALAIAERHDGTIHALITDVVMPGMNGRQLGEALQRARPGTPVLYMSGFAAPIMTERGLLAPGVTIVCKPFTKSELLNALSAVLSEQAAR